MISHPHTQWAGKLKKYNFTHKGLVSRQAGISKYVRKGIKSWNNIQYNIFELKTPSSFFLITSAE